MNYTVTTGFSMKKRTIIAILPLVAFAALTACGKIPHSPAPDKIDPYYLIGSREDRENLSALFTLLAKEDNTPEGTFAVVREIANSFARAKEYGRLIHFLGGRTINFPDDPYNSYYLLMIAYIYMQQDALPIAAQNFDLIVKNYPDLTVNGESIHYACLNQLINLSKYPVQRVWYYQELISRFSDRIDLGTAWFMLAQTYEQIGDWNSAIQAYTSYLPYAGTMIPGFPNADSYARQQVTFNNSRKDWTFESLPSLITAVKAALDAGSSWQLGRCQAKVNFFTRSWGQSDIEDFDVFVFNLSEFMHGNRIRYADELDPSSNSTEAFLRTMGWHQYLSTWYLYFRKIYFPADPEIHGRWEWAGIYYGEKF
jgi:tetratricopeptide (TPR) repeat protein